MLIPTSEVNEVMELLKLDFWHNVNRSLCHCGHHSRYLANEDNVVSSSVDQSTERGGLVESRVEHAAMVGDPEMQLWRL